MEPSIVRIADFRPDGYLPVGLHLASEAEATFRFGSTSRKRRRLVHRVRRWIELARHVRALRLFVDGSFVTAKSNPNGVDAVILLPDDFREQLAANVEAALELEEAISTRRPEELFAAEDEVDWNDWLEFFSRTREADGRRK
jgi:hypothetical protein